MAETPSTMVPIGTTAPSFSLPDPAGANALISLPDVRGAKGTLVMFICNHCPFVKHIALELSALGHQYLPKGIGMVAINSNDADKYPGDSPEEMAKEVERRDYPFPYIYDATQDVARAYEATCTPDFFLFNAEDRLVYRGRLDDSTPGNGRPVNGADLRPALDALVEGGTIGADQMPSVGCNIKWKDGG